MLNFIRSNTQSFGVKLAFGIIILVFVFWGVGSLTDQGSVNVVASVNGEPILFQQYERAYANAEETVLRNNPNVTREQLRAEHFGRQVLRQMVFQTLLRQEAARAGISVTPLELRRAVGEIKAFQNEQGRFDPAAYEYVLNTQRISPARYEQDLREELLRMKVQNLVAASAWIDPAEAQNRYNFLREQRNVEYIFIPAKEFMAASKPSEAEITAYYDGHKQEFAVPPAVDTEYVRVNPAELVKPESISVADAEAWYTANQSRFTEAEQVKAAHILVPLAENAPEADVKKAQATIAKIQAELKGGKSFATVADAHNGPNAGGPGGDLGWVPRGRTVKPFEDAAFALTAGQTSGPVRTGFGLHIIKVDEKKTDGTKPFKDVDDEARQALAVELGSEKMADVLDTLISDNILGKPLAESAAHFGLKAELTGLSSRQNLEQKLGLSTASAETLLATPAGSPVDTPLEAGNQYFVARVVKSEPASIKPLASVKEDIIKRMSDEKALKAALERAAALRKEIKDDAGSLPANLQKMVKSAPAVTRGSALGDFTPDLALSTALFANKVGAWLPAAFAVDGKEGAGALLAKVKSVQAPDNEEWKSVEAMLVDGVAQERINGLFQAFAQTLLNKAKVDVRNNAIVDRQ